MFEECVMPRVCLATVQRPSLTFRDTDLRCDLLPAIRCVSLDFPRLRPRNRQRSRRLIPERELKSVVRLIDGKHLVFSGESYFARP